MVDKMHYCAIIKAYAKSVVKKSLLPKERMILMAAFRKLNECGVFHTGYLIVEDTLFHVSEGEILEYFVLDAETITDKIEESWDYIGRTTSPIVVDTEGIYDACQIIAAGTLVDPYSYADDDADDGCTDPDDDNLTRFWNN